MKYQFLAHQFKKEVKRSITIFHVTKDAIVLCDSVERLFKAAPKSQTIFVTMEGAHHGDLNIFDVYRRQIENMLK